MRLMRSDQDSIKLDPAPILSSKLINWAPIMPELLGITDIKVFSL